MSKKGENIYKRKDNRWEARFMKARSDEGKIKYGYCYAKTYREVKEKLQKAKSDLLNEVIPSSELNKTFSLYIDEWLTVNRSTVKESTLVKYVSIINNHIKPYLGKYSANIISSKLIGEFSNRLLYEEKLSPKTVKDILVLLKSIVKFTAHSIPQMSNIEIVYPKDNKSEMKILSKSEQNRLINYLLSNIDLCKFGVLLSMMTGLRIGEICALKRKNISIVDRTITVNSTMQRLKNLDDDKEGKTRIYISNPKSDCSSRVIPLTDSLTNLCNKYLTNNPEDYILTGQADRYLEPRTLQNRIKKYGKECGISDLHFHMLRHTFATRCVEVGFEIKSLSEILGHSSPKITLERYVHSSMELKRNNMKKLSAVGF